jgi:hypothetical protein
MSTPSTPETKEAGKIRITEWIGVFISIVNLIVLIYVANLSIEQQKSLESFKKQLASATISSNYNTDNGILEIINTGETEAINIVVTIWARVDVDYRFMLPGIAQFNPTTDQILAPGRYIIFDVEKLSPSQKLVLQFGKNQEYTEIPSKEEIYASITCTNCMGAVEIR